MNKFEITPDESMTVERLYYIYKSNEIFCKLLAKELAEFPNDKKSKILKQYADECRLSFIKLDYTREQIINKYLGNSKNSIATYTFNFETHEVTYDL